MIDYAYFSFRGEKASFSSSKRKNKDRSIGAIDSLVSKKVGSICDMIFCKFTCIHDDTLEFGATETGKDYDGDDATMQPKNSLKDVSNCQNV